MCSAILLCNEFWLFALLQQNPKSVATVRLDYPSKILRRNRLKKLREANPYDSKLANPYDSKFDNS